MWPDLLGPGWQLQFIMALGLTAVLVGVIGLLWVAAGHTSPASPDGVLTAWRQYEVGDLTRQEFERFRVAVGRADRGQGRDRVRPRGVVPAGGGVLPVNSTVPQFAVASTPRTTATTPARIG
jgi:hypothetical protein